MGEINLTRFLFGNIDEDGELEADDSDQETYRAISSLGGNQHIDFGFDIRPLMDESNEATHNERESTRDRGGGNQAKSSVQVGSNFYNLHSKADEDSENYDDDEDEDYDEEEDEEEKPKPPPLSTNNLSTLSSLNNLSAFNNSTFASKLTELQKPKPLNSIFSVSVNNDIKPPPQKHSQTRRKRVNHNIYVILIFYNLFN